MIADVKHIAILGAGESGVGAAILAKKLGYKVEAVEAIIRVLSVCVGGES